MFKLTNPIPKFQDDPSAQAFFKEFNLIPYAGYTGASSHQFLRSLIDLYELSGSHGNCINDLAKWAFLGDVDVVKNRFEGLKYDQENVSSDSEREAFAEALAQVGLKVSDLINLVHDLYVSEKKTGNAYLYTNIGLVNGQAQVVLQVVDALDVMYLAPEEEEEQSKVVVISPDLYKGSFRNKEKIKVVRVFPETSRNDFGVETVFHFKHMGDNSTYYGRPDSIQSMFWMFTEWAVAQLNAKVANSETAVKSVVFMEGEDPNTYFDPTNPDGLTESERIEGLNMETEARPRSGIQGLMKEIRLMGTNEGSFEDVTSIIGIEYPNGMNPPSKLDFELNRDSKFLELTVKTASDYIYAAHGWSKTLNGFERQRSSIGGNAMLDEFLVKNTATIKPIQRKFERYLKQVLQFIGVESNSSILAEYTVRFQDNITELVKSIREADEPIKTVGGVEPIRDESTNQPE